MPTISLFTQPADANAWHAVCSPGGFEWWQFAAFDASSDTHVFVDFVEGDPYSRVYRDRFTQYLKKPTKFAPPSPGEFVRASVSICRGGKVNRGDVRSPLVASADSLRLAVASVAAHVEGNGAIRVVGVLDVGHQVDLTFTPSPGQLGTIQVTSQMQWIVASPRYEVTGSITSAGQTSSFCRSGFHEHFVSTQPLSRMDFGMGWFRARVTLPDATWLVNITNVFDSRLAGIKLIRVGAEGVTEMPIQRASMDYKPALPRICYPLTLGVEDRLTLKNPRVIDPGQPTRVVYDATIDGQSAIAIAEVVRSVGW